MLYTCALTHSWQECKLGQEVSNHENKENNENKENTTVDRNEGNTGSGLQARAVLMGQWGFGKNGDLAGTVCLFTGEPGTGKTLAAEAVGFETGKPLKVMS